MGTDDASKAKWRKKREKRLKRTHEDTKRITLDEFARQDDDNYVPVKRRKTMRTEHVRAQLGVKTLTQKREEDLLKRREEAEKTLMKQRDGRSLVEVHSDLKAKGEDWGDEDKTDAEKAKAAEKHMLDNLNNSRSLFISKAQAAGVSERYTKPVQTSWNFPQRILDQGPEYWEKLREKFHIETEVKFGGDVTPPIRKFEWMKLPPALLRGLAEKNIRRPTPIQMQGIPAILNGRDTIGIAYTGSGKTIVFCIPMIMMSLEEELKMPLIRGEGPLGISICPSRELATQTYDVVNYFTEKLQKYASAPELRTVLCIGGIDFREQADKLRSGIHMMVATPGRLKHSLAGKKFNFEILKYYAMDEADRLMDVGFDEDIRDIMSFFPSRQVQKVFFSATMPLKVMELAAQSMVMPLIVNVGRAGAANLDVIQEVEYVKEDAKIVYLLECLKKTAPPVLIFSTNQGDVDDVHEYLLLKGVDAAAIHGGKEQCDRGDAIKKFNSGEVDVLVATDVAGKGLDFPDIQHVINFDMPKEIEDYIHRIGRTGRCGKTGVATTFININVPETTLLDLKHLLIEASQRIPPILNKIGSNQNLEVDGVVGCAYCGGLGHRVTECPKFAKLKQGLNRGVVDDNMLMNQM